MAQLGAVSGLSRMEKSLQVAQASSMIGKYVTAYTTPVDGSPSMAVDGIADKIVKQDGEYWLSLRQADGTYIDVKMSSVMSVEEPPAQGGA
jgi:hypothetical protein